MTVGFEIAHQSLVLPILYNTNGFLKKTSDEVKSVWGMGELRLVDEFIFDPGKLNIDLF